MQVLKPQVKSAVGTLSHITFVHCHGCSYMSNLYRWLTTFPNDYMPHWISSSTLSNLQWWSSLLAQTHLPHTLSPTGPTHDYNIWVDVFTEWGIGLVWDTYWAAWQLHDGWKGPCRDIGWLEGVAVELAILVSIVMGICDADILIRSDNEGVIGAFSKGCCSNFMTNLSVRHSDEVCKVTGISTSLIYVNSIDNLTDPISRGLLPPISHIFPFLISIPSPLVPFISHVIIKPPLLLS